MLVSYVLTDATGEFGGTVVGEDGVKRLVLYRVTARCGSWHSSTASTRRTRGRASASRTRATHCTGGELEVELQSDAALFAEPNIVSPRRREVVGRVNDSEPDEARAARAASSRRRQMHRRVRRRAHSGTAVVTDGENPDPRELGMHFNRFTHRP